MPPSDKSSKSRGAAYVVATDFSPASEDAFHAGIQLARESGARLVLVHAVRPLSAPGLELTRPDTNTLENETVDAAALEPPGTAASWVSRATAYGVPCTLVVRAGYPANVLADQAERWQARAILVGPSAKDGLEVAFMGSVVEQLRARTSVPVHIVGPATQLSAIAG